MSPTDKYMVTVKFGLAEFKEPEYWFENGRIQCSTGSSIGYDGRQMTEKEAIVLAASGGIRLANCSLDKIGKQKE